MQNENKPLSKNLFQRFANKYTFVGLLFVIWIALFDKYSFIDRLQLRSKINQLENEQKYYREKIEEDKRKKEELLGNRWNKFLDNGLFPFCISQRYKKEMVKRNK